MNSRSPATPFLVMAPLEEYLGIKALKPFINNDLTMEEMVDFAMTGNDTGQMGEYIGAKALKPFIDKGLTMGEMVDLPIPGTQFEGSRTLWQNNEFYSGLIQIYAWKPRSVRRTAGRDGQGEGIAWQSIYWTGSTRRPVQNSL